MNLKTDILYYAFSHGGEVSVFDILYETGIPYRELKGVLEACVAEHTLETADGKHYRFVGEDNFGEEYKAEARRRDLLGRLEAMRPAPANDDDDDDDFLSSFTGGSKEAEERPSALDEIKNAVEIGEEGGQLCILVKWLVFNGSVAKFFLREKDGKKILGDGGAALTALGERIVLNEDIVADIRDIAQSGMVEFVGGDLVTEVEGMERLLACAIRIYCVMRRVLRIEGTPQSKEELPSYYLPALELVVKTKEASVSELQRALSIRYVEASRALEWMEQNGYISSLGEGKRMVLLPEREFYRKFKKA